MKEKKTTLKHLGLKMEQWKTAGKKKFNSQYTHLLKVETGILRKKTPGN